MTIGDKNDIETTWEQFTEELIALAEQNDEGYLIYEHNGKTGYLSFKELGERKGNYPGRMVAEITKPVIVFDGVAESFVKLPSGIESIRSDKYVRLRGGQPGNRNRANGKYPRHVISLSGPIFDRMMNVLVEENNPPSQQDVERAVYAALAQVYPEQEQREDRR